MIVLAMLARGKEGDPSEQGHWRIMQAQAWWFVHAFHRQVGTLAHVYVGQWHMQAMWEVMVEIQALRATL